MGSAWELIEKFNSVSNKPSTIYEKESGFLIGKKKKQRIKYDRNSTISNKKS